MRKNSFSDEGQILIKGSSLLNNSIMKVYPVISAMLTEETDIMFIKDIKLDYKEYIFGKEVRFNLSSNY